MTEFRTRRNAIIIFVIFLTFFVISFITNIMGPIIPALMKSFDLNLTLASVIPLSFFAAYGVMSIPAGFILEKFGAQKILISSFLVIFMACILFAVIKTYTIALLSLFTIGLGMAVLQVAINPLLRSSGGEENFAFFSVIAQLVFGGGSFLSPLVYTHVIKKIDNMDSASILHQLIPKEMSWISMYWLFGIITLGMILVYIFLRLPKVELNEEETAGSLSSFKTLIKKPVVVLFFIGIFSYVGTEQGIANWLSQYLYEVHQLAPETTGAKTVSLFWGALTIGCFLGLLLLKLMDSRKVLIGFSAATIISLIIALNGTASISLIFFPIAGFFASVMWSIIFSLALNSVEKHHGAFSGILCTGIIGGAIVPFIIGSLGDVIGLKYAMYFLMLPLGFILSIGFWARPLVKNKTLIAP